MLEVVIAGLTVSGTYLLVSLGLTLALRLGDIVNLAHGSYVIGGAFLTIAVVRLTGWGHLLGGLAAVIIGLVIAYVFYVLVIRDGVRRGHRQQIVYTILLIGLIEALLLITFGPDLQSLGNQPVGWDILGVTMRRERVVAFLIACAVCIAVFSFLKWTSTGRLMEATGRYPDSAKAMGVNVQRSALTVYLLSSALALLAGVLIVGYVPVSPFLGLEFLTIAVIISLAARLSFGWLPVTAAIYGLGVEVASVVTGSPTTATVIVMGGFLAVMVLAPVIASLMRLKKTERAI